jgi:gamma-glutamyltranspeptidase/glutathione hydrolase
MAVAPFPTRLAPNGMVCSVDHLASEAGVAMLRAGGSAADAAIATSAVLAVTTQHMCGMGGDLFALVSRGRGVVPDCLNASGRAGSGADPDRLRAEGHHRMPFAGDIRSVPVPGCVDGWIALHERYGRLPLAEVLEPARAYAADGFPASPTLVASVPRVRDLPGAEAYSGTEIRPGTIIRRPGVARTLAAVAAGGRAAFYEGEFGDGLIELGGGEYTGSDLRQPLADWAHALTNLVHLGGRDHVLATAPPNSQGYLTLLSASIAMGLPLPNDSKDPLWAHLLIEAARQAGFDRVERLHEGFDGRELFSPDVTGPRRAAIDPDRAAVLDEPAPRAGGTIYLCAVDKDRMGVSLIQSNASGWGAGIFEPRTGISLQNRGIGFSLQPGHPAEYGPGRRPPHTLSPAMVTDLEGNLEMVIGTMGGDSQPQILLQLLARLLHNGQSPGEAIAAGRWALGPAGEGSGFETWNERGRVRVDIEGHAPSAWAAGLHDRGHDVRNADAFSHAFGHAHVIVNHGDHLAGAADPRPRSGSASGY